MMQVMDRVLALDPTSGFDEIYEENIRYVYNYARARLGPDDGEDVAAEVFTAALKTCQAGRSVEVTTAWLMAVCHRKVIDRWRRAHTRRSRWSRVVASTPLTTVDDVEHVDGDPQRAAVLRALDSLSPRHRAALVLHHVDGLSAPTIAEQLGLSVAATESLVARARRAFRGQYVPPVEEG